MEAQEFKDTTEDLARHAGDYLDTFYKVAILNVTKKATNIASAAISAIVVCILGMFVLFFFGFGVAWWLADVIKSKLGAFMIVGGFYLIIGIIIILFRRKMVFPFIRNLLIQKVYE